MPFGTILRTSMAKAVAKVLDWTLSGRRAKRVRSSLGGAEGEGRATGAAEAACAKEMGGVVVEAGVLEESSPLLVEVFCATAAVVAVVGSVVEAVVDAVVEVVVDAVVELETSVDEPVDGDEVGDPVVAGTGMGLSVTVAAGAAVVEAVAAWEDETSLVVLVMVCVDEEADGVDDLALVAKSVVRGSAPVGGGDVDLSASAVRLGGVVAEMGGPEAGGRRAPCGADCFMTAIVVTFRKNRKAIPAS